MPMTLRQLCAWAGCPETASWEEIQAAIRSQTQTWTGEEGGSLEALQGVALKRKAELERQLAELQRRRVPPASPARKIPQTELKRWEERLEALGLLLAADRFKERRTSLDHHRTEKKLNRARLDLEALRDITNRHAGVFEKQLQEAEADFQDTFGSEVQVPRPPAPPPEQPKAVPAERPAPAPKAPGIPPSPDAPPPSQPPQPGGLDQRAPPAQPPAVHVATPSPPPATPVSPPIPAEIPTPGAQRRAVPPTAPGPSAAVDQVQPLSAAAPPRAEPAATAPAPRQEPTLPAWARPPATTPAPVPPPTGPRLARESAPVAPTPRRTVPTTMTPRGAADAQPPTAAPPGPTQPAQATSGPSAPAAPTPASAVVEKPRLEPPGKRPPTGPVPTEGAQGLRLAPTIHKPHRPPEVPVAPPAPASPAVEITIPKPPAPSESSQQPAPVVTPPAPQVAPVAPHPEPRVERSVPSPAEPAAKAEAPSTAAAAPEGITEAPMEAPAPARRGKTLLRVAAGLFVCCAAVALFIFRDEIKKFLVPRIFAHPSSQTTKPGGEIELRVRATSLMTAVTYRWFFNGSPAAGGTQEVYRIAAAQPSDAGEYFAIVSNMWGTAMSRLAKVTLSITAPVVTVQPASPVVREGNSVTFSADVSSDVPFTVQWYHGADRIWGATGRTWTLSGVGVEDSGQVMAVAQNSGGSATNTATLSVLQPPNIQAQPASQAVTQGSDAVFAIKARGSPARCQWYRNDRAITGETNLTLEVPRVGAGDTGDYHAVLSNPVGQVRSQTAVLSLKVSGPPTPVTQPSGANVAEGAEVILSFETRGEPPIAYTWYRDGQTVGSGQSTLRLKPVSVAMGGRYYAVAVNSLGRATSAVAQVEVRARQAPRILDGQAPASQSLREGVSVVFTVGARGAPEVAALIYQWLKDGRALAGETNAALMIERTSKADAGTYQVVVGDGLKTVTHHPVTLSFSGEFAILEQPKNQAAPEGGSVTFSAEAHGPNVGYRWRKGNKNGPIVGTNRLMTLTGLQKADGGGYFVEVYTEGDRETFGPATLTVTDRPAQSHVNTLGMSFVSIKGSEVWFSVWETRNKDFAVFVASDPTGHQIPWSHPGVLQDNHPAVGVNWDDTRDFCRWLNEKELRDGRLPRGRKYRLPRDLEWSLAADFGGDIGPTPGGRHDRAMKDKVVQYPWGRNWPPPNLVSGNYADVALRRKYPSRQQIPDYNDAFADTSPVGAFPPNRFGLFDLGGNAWEWVEETWEGSRGSRHVLRGGSFMTYSPDSLRSWYRHEAEIIWRYPDFGFRVVLAPE